MHSFLQWNLISLLQKMPINPTCVVKFREPQLSSEKNPPQTITHPSDFIFGRYLQELTLQNPAEINSPRNGLFKLESALFIAVATHWLEAKSQIFQWKRCTGRRERDRVFLHQDFHKHWLRGHCSYGAALVRACVPHSHMFPVMCAQTIMGNTHLYLSSLSFNTKPARAQQQQQKQQQRQQNETMRWPHWYTDW